MCEFSKTPTSNPPNFLFRVGKYNFQDVQIMAKWLSVPVPWVQIGILKKKFEDRGCGLIFYPTKALLGGLYFTQVYSVSHVMIS